MKVFGWIRALVAAGVIGAALVGTAEAARAPSGSYLDTCERAYARGGVLHALCEKRRGRYVWARLDNYSGCIGDIGNYYGKLICLRKRDVPRGNWSESCINPHLFAPDVFAAVCKSLRGGWIASHIDLDKCRLGITNVKGTLGCMKAEAHEEPPPVPPTPATPRPHDETPPSSPPPPADGYSPQPAQALPVGSYQRSCRNLEFDGRYLDGECRDKRGAWQDTSLDTQGCAHDQEIGNSNGLLVCSLSTFGREPPAGRYQASCRKLTFDGRFVRGECQEDKGTYTTAVLDTRTCRDGDDILNNDGEIVCRHPQPPPRPAPAAGQAAHAPSPTTAPPPAATSPAKPAGAIVATTTPPPSVTTTTTPPPAPANVPPPPSASTAAPTAPAGAATPPPAAAPVAPAGSATPPPPPAPAAPAGPATPPPSPATVAPAGSATPAPSPTPVAPAGSATPAPSTAPAAPTGSAGAPPESDNRRNSGAAPGHDPETGGRSSPPGEAMTITLYEKKSFGGANRSFSGDAADLAPLGWNDLALSLQVRGTWEVCEEPNFGGHCERIAEDEPNLGELKLSRRISSFRRVPAIQH